MSLDNFSKAGSTEAIPSASNEEKSAIKLFGDSALYELNQSAFGLAQSVGLEGHLPIMAVPEESESAVGRNLQMLGRGVGSFLPTLGVALSTKFAFGKLVSPRFVGSENLLLQKSAIGLNVAESGIAGAVTGALLKPTDKTSAETWSGFVTDRAVSGLTNGLSFSVLTSMTFGLNKFAGTKLSQALGAEAFLKSAPINGLISGAAGGLLNVETSTFVSQGKLTTDRNKIYSSVYEAGVMGGLFGLTAFASNHMAREENSSHLRPSNAAHTNALDSDAAHTNVLTSDATYTKALTLFPNDMEPRPLNLTGLTTVEPPALTHYPIKANGSVLPDFPKTYREATWSSPAPAVEHSSNLERLNAHFSDDPLLLDTLLRYKRGSGSALINSLADYIDDNPAKRLPFAKEQAERGQPFDAQRFKALEHLEEIYGRDSSTVSGLVQHEANDYFLSGLVRFINKDPQKHSELVRNLVQEGADETGLSPVRLEALHIIQKHFKGEPTVVTKLSTSRLDGEELMSVADFVALNPEAHARLVVEQVEKHEISSNTLDPMRLQAIIDLGNQSGPDSPILTKLFSKEEKRPNDFLCSLNYFIRESPKTRLPIIEKLVQEDTPPWFYDLQRLEAKEKLEQLFGAKSETLDQIYKVEKYNWDLQEIIDFAGNESDTRVPLMHRIMAASPEPGQLNFHRLLALEDLSNKLHDEPELADRLFRQIKVGSEPLQISQFIEPDPAANIPFLRKVLDLGASGSSLSKLSELKNVFLITQTTIKRLDKS